jgi:hypothetical protein
MTGEQWRDVAGWSGFYQVSSHYRVRSVDRVIIRSDGRKLPAAGKILRQQLDNRCLHSVILQRPGQRLHRYVHLLVRDAFGDKVRAA